MERTVEALSRELAEAKQRNGNLQGEIAFLKDNLAKFEQTTIRQIEATFEERRASLAEAERKFEEKVEAECSRRTEALTSQVSGLTYSVQSLEGQAKEYKIKLGAMEGLLKSIAGLRKELESERSAGVECRKANLFQACEIRRLKRKMRGIGSPRSPKMRTALSVSTSQCIATHLL